MRLRAVVGLVLVSLLAAAPRASAALLENNDRPRWKQRIDTAIGDRPMGVAVLDDGVLLYAHSERTRRIPASTEKLLMSMPLLDTLGPRAHVTTTVVAESSGEVVDGDVWLVGSGDPTVTGGGSYGRTLPFTPTRLGRIARKMADAGVRRIDGQVIGSISFFEHDWFATGWKEDFPAQEVALPSALTFEGNIARGRHIDDPEVRAARSLTKRLEENGVEVAGKPGTGAPPASANATLARVRSAPLQVLLGFTNKQSSNFFAEILGKRLGVEVFGEPGTIAEGARAITAWARDAGVEVEAYDSSGLSYANRISALGLGVLLGVAEDTRWGHALRRTLAAPGQGTLESRLDGIRIRAKTGTLEQISALAGYVWLERSGSWAEFAILSGGVPKWTATDIENRIVTIVSRRARS